MDLEKAIKTYQVAIMKAPKEKKTAEGQFVVLESENAALNKALKEGKAALDEAIAMANSLKSE